VLYEGVEYGSAYVTGAASPESPPVSEVVRVIAACAAYRKIFGPITKAFVAKR
jgi:hypothetical protein